jgi:hypothetical protein
MSSLVPVWHDARMPAAALTLALGGALALGAYAGDVPLLLAILLLQAILLSGWHGTFDAPGALGGVALAAASSLAADLLLLVRDDPRPLTPVAGVLGLTMLGAFVHQLVRRPPREGLTASLTTTTMLVVVSTIACLFLAAAQSRGGTSLVALSALAAALAAVVDLLPLPTLVRAAIGAISGIVLGAVFAGMTDLSVGSSLVVGGAAAATAVAMTAFVRRAARPALTTVAALPVAGAAPFAYVLGRILMG